MTLLDSLAADSLAAEAQAQQARDAAGITYWAVIDSLASGDATGGIEPETFRRILATLKHTPKDVERDVAEVLSVRSAETQHTEAKQQLATARAEREAAWNTEEVARRAAEAALRERNAADGRYHHAKEVHEQAANQFARAKDHAAQLAARGFAGRLLQAPPPPPPPVPMRSVR